MARLMKSSLALLALLPVLPATAQTLTSVVDSLIPSPTALVSVTSATAAPASESGFAYANGTASRVTETLAGTTLTYRPEFTVPASADSGAPLLPNIYDPDATDAQNVCPGYTASNVVENDIGFSAMLSLAGQPCNVYGNDIDMLDLTVEYQNADRLSVYIRPAVMDASNMSHYILSEDILPRPGADGDARDSAQENDFQFVWTNEPTFQFSVIRKTTGDVAFTTMGSKLVFEDQFVEFVTDMPENYNVYGLGERIHGFRLGNNFTATIYAADAGDPIDYNIYGSHPVYVDTRYYSIDDESGNMTMVSSDMADASQSYKSYSHGVFLRNAHGQEILMREGNITWRTLGGSIDLYFFDGPSVTEVNQQYQNGAIGRPVMQQYFSFGYHQCRWGYENWTVLQDVVDNFARFGIPLDNIWTDIDYMRQYRDFTLDPISFPVDAAQEFFQSIASTNQHYIPIVDSALYIPNPENETDAYDTYARGHEQDVFIKNQDGTEYIGAVWPGYTVFPDWMSSNAGEWWTNEMLTWYREVNFSGIWIDMSEASSFCVGSCGTGNLTLNQVHPSFSLPGEVGNVIYDYPEGFNVTNSTEAAIASSLSAAQASALAASTSSIATETAPTTGSIPMHSTTSTQSYLRTTPTPGVRDVNHPPYVINNVQGDLAVHAIAPNATHNNGVLEYDVHNVWGHQILNATYNALRAVFPGKRPFIIGRSTFAGSGKYAGHWGGDNASKWYYMYFSIPQALSFSIFGIPMFGVDTCGFNGNSDEELCNRWMSLSAFFPFYRNHNTLTANPQEPYVWSSVIDASKAAMAIRYALLPYMYTLFYQAHTTASTVMRALAWEFPNDPSLANADRQFLLGPALMVTPVLEQGATSVQGVFPGVKDGEIWYDWYTQSRVDAQAGVNTTIQAPLGHIPVYVRGGYILPMQEPALTTYAAKRTPWALLVALSSGGSAYGSIYIDDGESLSPNTTKNVDLVATNNTLYASVRGTYADGNALANVTVLGVSAEPRTVTLNNMTLSNGWMYNATSGALEITDLTSATSRGAWVRDWTLRWT